MAGELRHRRVPSEDGDEGAAASQGPDPAAGNGKAGTASEGAEPRRGKRDALGWLEWGRGWMAVVGEFLFQRIAASHLANPLELPPLDGVSVVVTGATSGIGLEIARCLLCFPPPAPFVLFSSAHTPQDVIVNLWWTDLLDGRCARIAAACLFIRTTDNLFESRSV